MQIELKRVELQVAVEFEEMHEKILFPGDVEFNPDEILSEDEKSRLKELNSEHKGGIKLAYGVFADNQLVGFHYGRQMERGVFHMGQSGVLPGFQGKGLYTQLLKFVLEDLSAEGFQIATSRPNAGNNAIIIPKLKAGFLIAGFEINDTVGLQVRLTYYFNPIRKGVHLFRTGRADLPNGARAAMVNFNSRSI